MHRRHQSLAPHAHLLLRCGSAVVTPDDYITEEQLRSLPSRRAWVVDVAGGAWGLRMVPIPPNGKRKIELPFPKSSVWEMSTLSSSKRRSQTIIARSSAFLLRWFHFCSACRKAYSANPGVLGRNSQVNACNRSRGYGILNLAMSYSAFVGTLIGVRSDWICSPHQCTPRTLLFPPRRPGGSKTGFSSWLQQRPMGRSRFSSPMPRIPGAVVFALG